MKIRFWGGFFAVSVLVHAQLAQECSAGRGNMMKQPLGQPMLTNKMICVY